MLLVVVFVHNRLIFPSLVWVFFLVAVGAHTWWTKAGKRGRLLSAVLLLMYLAGNAVYTVSAFQNEFTWWRYRSIVKTAQRMKSIASEEDVVMTYGPCFSIEFYTNNPLKTIEMPYGTLEDVETVAAKNDVRFILVSDVFREHWPIAKVHDSSQVLPSNWQVVDTLRFDEDPHGYRYPAENVAIIERRTLSN